MLPTLPTHLKPLSIGALTAQIKNVLEETFSAVCVTGEISSLSVAASGHVYFTLKDTTAVMPSVMWKTTATRHRYGMKDGMEVVVCGKLTVYPPHGKYQLTVDQLFQTGVGAQDLALQRLKDKLKRLGYFALERKRPLPRYPRRIALVTSRSGAAVRDMLEIICRRWRCAELWVCSVRVQGAGAREDIVAALERLNQLAGVDVMLLGRGGGSSEDLAVFNEEAVANAIFASKIPIISAVGHEIDVTIADLVADCRAATPSEAAERATPDRLEWLKLLRARHDRLSDLLVTKYQTLRHRLDSVMRRRVFQFPLERLHEQERRADDWDVRLRRAMQRRVERATHKLAAAAAHLDSLSPLNVLARGYSLTRTLPAKIVVRSVEQANVGDAIEVVLADGTLQADVKSKEKRREE
jgi:exodeoxyribonuclease VII large subunit